MRRMVWHRRSTPDNMGLLPACVLLIFVAAAAELPRREWQRILVRVLGSWCAAIAVLVLALALRQAGSLLS